MSDNVQEPSEVELDELALLKKRADSLGVEYSNNIGLETLKKRINEILDNEPETKIDSANQQKKAQTRADKIREANKLIRIRYSNMNPAKKDFPGEVLTVANNVVGTLRKFIPYGDASEAGYHVPQAIYEMMKRREFTVSVSKRDEKGRPYQTTRKRKEFAIEVLEPLTKEELKKLAADQRSTGRV